MTSRYDSMLEGLTRLRGIRGALIVDATDGLVVAEAVMGEMKGSALAALAAGLSSRAGELAVRVGFGVPKMLHLEATDGSLLVARATPDIILVAIAGRDVAIGLLRLEMLRTAEQLA
ncbi:MAG TPA: roadblock/LC7 domain-containing protein [Gemmatimonadales bacterium]|jgi:predicted regulator of Ras-like GTPase activity (Roadblock/LC7/MglB family)